LEDSVGFEYRLSFAHADINAALDTLVHLAGAKRTAAPTVRIELRRDPSDTGMPDATLVPEDYGLYFCDHGGYGQDYLGHVVVQLVRTFGAVTVEEVE
jgi:hypothetical protein